MPIRITTRDVGALHPEHPDVLDALEDLSLPRDPAFVADLTPWGPCDEDEDGTIYRWFARLADPTVDALSTALQQIGGPPYNYTADGTRLGADTDGLERWAWALVHTIEDLLAALIRIQRQHLERPGE